MMLSYQHKVRMTTWTKVKQQGWVKMFQTLFKIFNQQTFFMQQFNGRPATHDRRDDNNRRQQTSMEGRDNYQDRRIGGEPAKFNTRSEQRRISWENDLYERQSI